MSETEKLFLLAASYEWDRVAHQTEFNLRTKANLDPKSCSVLGFSLKNSHYVVVLGNNQPDEVVRGVEQLLNVSGNMIDLKPEVVQFLQAKHQAGANFQLEYPGLEFHQPRRP